MNTTVRLAQIETRHRSYRGGLPTPATNDVPALVNALRAVLKLHQPGEPHCSNVHHDPTRCPCATVRCEACEGDAVLGYPCPTVEAIEEALNA